MCKEGEKEVRVKGDMEKNQWRSEGITELEEAEVGEVSRRTR